MIYNSNGIIEVTPNEFSAPYTINITYPNGSVLTDIFSRNIFDGRIEWWSDMKLMDLRNGNSSSNSVELSSNILLTNFFSPTFSFGGYN